MIIRELSGYLELLVIRTKADVLIFGACVYCNLSFLYIILVLLNSLFL